MSKFEDFRKEFPEFRYASYKISETEDSVDIEYEFDITGLSEFHGAGRILLC